MKIPFTLPVISLALISVVLSSCGGDSGTSGGSDNTSGSPSFYKPAVTVDANGFKVANIPLSATNTGVLKWKITGSNIAFQISCATNGWLGMGINPSGSMTGADIVMGYVAGTATVEDMYAGGLFAPTTDITNHLSAISGTEAAGRTELAFTRALNTGDSQDKILVAGQETVMLFACGPNDADNFMTLHQHKLALLVIL